MGTLLLLGNLCLVMGRDCHWDSAQNKAISEFPMNPYRSCLSYCQSYYSRAPQRQYYNLTSEMCEPRRRCLSAQSHYDYPTNLCYTDASLSEQA